MRSTLKGLFLFVIFFVSVIIIIINHSIILYVILYVCIKYILSFLIAFFATGSAHGGHLAPFPRKGRTLSHCWCCSRFFSSCVRVRVEIPPRQNRNCRDLIRSVGGGSDHPASLSRFSTSADFPGGILQPSAPQKIVLDVP